MSDIIPGQIAGQDDSPKRECSNRNSPLRSNDAFKEFIKAQLLEKQFCVRSGKRNIAAQEETQGESSSLRPSTFSRLIPPPPLEIEWEKFRDAIKSPKMETSVNRLLCKFLTLLAENSYLFVPGDNETAGEDGGLLPQDIIVVDSAKREDIDRFVQGNLALPDEFHYRDDKGTRSRIYFSDVKMVGKVKVTDEPTSVQVLFNHATQVLKYLFTTSQFQPRHAFHIGFLAYRNGFIIIDYYPDRAFFSHLFKWDDPAARIALRKAISDLKDRGFTTKQFNSIKATDCLVRSRLSFCLSGKFAATDTVYRLFDLHRGDGWHRNAYVGIGVCDSIGSSGLNWKVIKHYWHDMGRRFNELQILQHIYARPSTKKLCTAGIVQVNLLESQVLAQDNTPASSGSTTGGDYVPRQSVLLVMESLGQALSACTSTMQFLKAMYDLVEVHRMLVEEHQVLHRDISWGNVLINATHTGKGQQDDLCGRPFIDTMMNVNQEARKVHVMLSDFDCACILGSSKMRESPTRGEITGTPMFMAKSLCSNPTTLNNVGADPSPACKLVFPQGATGAIGPRQNEVKQFLEMVQRYRHLVYSDEISSIIEPQDIVHAPMHDAESIFWLISLFFIRACPKDYDPTSSASGEWGGRREQRTEIFKSMVINGTNRRQDYRCIPDSDSLPPQFHPLVGMLFNLNIYFRQLAWHHPYFLQVQDNGVPDFIRFHAHNALQAVLLKAILQLQTNGDIEIKPTPLGVDDDFPFIPDSKSFISANLKRGRVPADEGESDEKVKKKRKKSHASKTDSPDNTVNTTAMIENDPEFEFLMSAIECDARSRLWFMGDRDYVEHAFVEA